MIRLHQTHLHEKIIIIIIIISQPNSILWLGEGLDQPASRLASFALSSV